MYAARALVNWDIYLLRVGGKNPINLTADSSAENTQPTFSPDGERIAFRSERSGGGIFIMGATGESVRRLTDFGYNPGWSPDGQEIVFGTARAENPASRYGSGSELWAVSAASGEKRQITTLNGVPDAVQPNWSPHRHRIAYWSSRGGQRDIWTISENGSQPVAVTQDIHLDWGPVWSPDGKYLYFVSDRSGSMNLWRVPLDEESGKVMGQPAAVTTPSPYSGPLTISRDGRRIAYVQQLTTAGIQKAEFDAAKESIVLRPQRVVPTSRYVTTGHLSPDGERLAFMEGGQEDIFVIKTDATGLQQLTNDTFKDRFPRWSPDGERIAFYSNRSGKFDIWLINPDGSSLKQLSYTAATTVIFPVWSPDGKRLAFTDQDVGSFIMEVAKPWKEQSPRSIVASPEFGARLYVFSWSADGRKLAGDLRRIDGTPNGIGIYSLESDKPERLTDFGIRPVWLRDSRRLLFHDGGKLLLIQPGGKPRELLSVAPHRIDMVTLSRDDRIVYLSIIETESDIWLATIE